MVFGIVAIGFIARTVFVLALARNVEVFDFNLTRNSESFTLERELRFRFNRSQNSSCKARRIDTLVLGQIILQPGHCRTVLAIPDNAGVTARRPGCTIDITPNGDTRNVFIFHEVGNLLRVAVLLVVIIIRCNIVFRNEQRNLGLGPNFFDGRLQSIDVQAGTATALATGLTTGNLHVMSLQAIGIHRSAGFLKLLDKVNTFVFLPLDGIVVVVNQDCIRPTFTGHSEGFRHEFVVAVIATESLDNIGARIVGVILSLTRTDSFVHHVDHFEIGVMLGNSIEPFSDNFLCFRSALALNPVRILGSPHKSVELEVTAILLCPVVGGIATTPVELSTSGVDRTPLTFVFSRNLVPKLRKVATNLTARRNVTDEFCSTIGKTGACIRTYCPTQKCSSHQAFQIF